MGIYLQTKIKILNLNLQDSKYFLIEKFFLYYLILIFLFSCNPQNLLYVPFDKHTTDSIVSNGDTRFFTYFVPALINDDSLPLLFVLHGGGGYSNGMIYLTRLSDYAQKYNFIVVYPQGYGNRWNDGRNLPHSETDKRKTDDVQFLFDLNQFFRKKFSIKKNNVGIVGLSNGGLMAITLACNVKDGFTHFISIGGGMSQPQFNKCKPESPKKLLFISGEQDEVIPFNGGQAFTFSNGNKIDLGRIVPFSDTLNFWSNINQCKSNDKEIFTDSYSNAKDENTRFLFNQCMDNSILEGISLRNGKHNWPHGYYYKNESENGYLNNDMDATMQIVNFLLNK